jgi:hypothetical protein
MWLCVFYGRFCFVIKQKDICFKLMFLMHFELLLPINIVVFDSQYLSLLVYQTF